MREGRGEGREQREIKKKKRENDGKEQEEGGEKEEELVKCSEWCSSHVCQAVDQCQPSPCPMSSRCLGRQYCAAQCTGVMPSSSRGVISPNTILPHRCADRQTDTYTHTERECVHRRQVKITHIMSIVL